MLSLWPHGPMQEFNEKQKLEFEQVQRDVRYSKIKFAALAKVYEALTHRT